MTQESKDLQKWVVLLVSSISNFMVPFDSSVVNLALPTIASSLQASLTYVIWIPTVYLLAIASLETMVGRLGDMKGKRNLFTAGVAVFTIGSFLAGLSGSVYQLLVDRIIQGIGAATIDAVGLSLLVSAFPDVGRGRVLGINITAVYSGLTTGPVAGGFLVQTLGWRSIFFVNVPIGILTALLTLLYLKKDSAFRTSERFDLGGALALTVFLSSLLVILSQGGLGLSGLESALADVTCLASLLCFVYIELRVSSAPLLDLHLFTRNKLFAAGSATSFLNYMSSAGSLLILSLYLQLALGYSPISAGLVLLAQPLMMVLSSPIAGTLSDRISARVLSSSGMFAKAAGFLALSTLGTTSPAQAVWIPLVVVGLGHGFFSSPNINSVLSSVPRSRSGIASGTLGTIRTTGNSIGIAVMGAIVAASLPPAVFSALAGGAAISPALTGSFVQGVRLAFIYAAAASALGGFVSLTRGKKHAEPEG